MRSVAASAVAAALLFACATVTGGATTAAFQVNTPNGITPRWGTPPTTRSGTSNLVAPPRAKPTIVADVDAPVSTSAAAGAATNNKNKMTSPTFKRSNAKVARSMDEGVYNFNKAVIDTVYDIICFLYPVKGTERDFARFYVLETVARVPYFAYLSVMHLRETFGERSSDLSSKMRTHYAEADNELHHLLIMESLGGNSSVIDRTVAQTMAFGYYWYVVGVYAFSEQAAYHLSELIEDHAFETYDKYLTEYEDMLRKMPVPPIATRYYVEDNPFLFDLFCTVKNLDDNGEFSSRRPKLESLYDVFVNVRDDEKEHWKTLCNLVQYDDMQGCDSKTVEGTKIIPSTASS